MSETHSSSGASFTRELQPGDTTPGTAYLYSLPAPGVEEDAALREWLLRWADAAGLTYLLAHAYDGVIWGKVQSGKLLTSGEAAAGDPEAERVCPRLRAETLLQARLFSPAAELLLWRDEAGFRARLFSEKALSLSTPPQSCTAWWFDEPQMLWGDHGRALAEGFTLLSEGREGLRHAIPPLDKSLFVGEPEKRATRPLWLVARNYVTVGGTLRGGPESSVAAFSPAELRIAGSRLLDLTIDPPVPHAPGGPQ